VICLKTALAAFDSIVLQGEGSPSSSAGSHFERFASIRSEYQALKAANPGFAPSHPAATNPVLRRPPRPEGRGLPLGLMHAMAVLGTYAARLPAGPSHPECNAGMSFTALRDAASLPVGVGARRFFVERLGELANAATLLAGEGSPEVASAAQSLRALADQASREFDLAVDLSGPVQATR
jgi:hypothetical protein